MSRTTTRPAFCLGCGKDCGTVEVSAEGIQPTPAELPAWCREQPCRIARDSLRETLDEILGH